MRPALTCGTVPCTWLLQTLSEALTLQGFTAAGAVETCTEVILMIPKGMHGR